MYTYYRIPDRKVSFRLVADHHIRALRDKGHTVLEKDLLFRKKTFRKHGAHTDSIALIHPLFYYANWHGMDFDQVMEGLHHRHQSIYGFEVADTDALSGRFVAWANHPSVSGIMLPTQFSIDSFRQSGVVCRLEKVPHGIEMKQPDKTFGYLKKAPTPNILFFAAGDYRRKGLDLLLEIIPLFPDCTFVIKRAKRDRKITLFPGNKNVVVIRKWLSPAALASLYSNCDVFLALHRGGAFELNCLEALSYGLPVLAPNYGAVLDYLTPKNATLISGWLKTGLHAETNDHSGQEFHCDLQDTATKLRAVLDNLDENKRRARNEREKIKQEFTWEKAADLIMEFTS